MSSETYVQDEPLGLGATPAVPAGGAVTEAAPELGLVSLVVPAMNEERNIGWVLERVPDVVDEVILIDGHSTDDTVAVARATYPEVVVVRQEGRGKGAALRTGFAAARGEFVVMIDADGSMEPAEITRFVDRLKEGADLVKGSRYVDGGGSSDITFLRSLGNRTLMLMVNLLYGARFTDLCYGYCGFRRRGLRAMALDADGFEIETQIAVRALKAKLEIGEVPSFESPRHYGQSNLNTFRDGQRVLRTLIRERLRRAPRAAALPAPLDAARSETPALP